MSLTVDALSRQISSLKKSKLLRTWARAIFRDPRARERLLCPISIMLYLIKLVAFLNQMLILIIMLPIQSTTMLAPIMIKQPLLSLSKTRQKKEVFLKRELMQLASLAPWIMNLTMSFNHLFQKDRKETQVKRTFMLTSTKRFRTTMKFQKLYSIRVVTQWDKTLVILPLWRLTTPYYPIKLLSNNHRKNLMVKFNSLLDKRIKLDHNKACLLSRIATPFSWAIWIKPWSTTEVIQWLPTFDIAHLFTRAN